MFVEVARIESIEIVNVEMVQWKNRSDKKLLRDSYAMLPPSSGGSRGEITAISILCLYSEAPEDRSVVSGASGGFTGQTIWQFDLRCYRFFCRSGVIMSDPGLIGFSNGTNSYIVPPLLLIHFANFTLMKTWGMGLRWETSVSTLKDHSGLRNVSKSHPLRRSFSGPFSLLR